MKIPSDQIRKRSRIARQQSSLASPSKTGSAHPSQAGETPPQGGWKLLLVGLSLPPMSDEALDCSIAKCGKKAEYLMLFSLTPSRVDAVKDAHLLLPSGYRCCQRHLPKCDFWSYVKEPDWEELCQALEEKGIARPIREMAELTFLRLP